VQLARAAAAARPDFVVLKDLQGYLRGREPGEVPAVLQAELQRQGIPESAMRTLLPEVEAARAILDWSQSGDVLVLPVHNLAARAALVQWLDAEAGASR
jgi:cyanophycin synthetase